MSCFASCCLSNHSRHQAQALPVAGITPCTGSCLFITGFNGCSRGAARPWAIRTPTANLRHDHLEESPAHVMCYQATVALQNLAEPSKRFLGVTGRPDSIFGAVKEQPGSLLSHVAAGRAELKSDAGLNSMMARSMYSFLSIAVSGRVYGTHGGWSRITSAWQNHVKLLPDNKQRRSLPMLASHSDIVWS